MKDRKRKSPGKPTPQSAGAERIVAAATRLFAEKGFTGVSTREIADAVGLNISTVHHHVGVKRDLYLAVLRNIDLEEREMVSVFTAAADDATLRDPNRAAQLFIGLVDGLLDTICRNPNRARLHLRRWLEAPDELMESEAALSRTLYDQVHKVMMRAQKIGIVRRDLDPWMFFRSFSWLMYGYFASGPMTPKAWRGDPCTPRNLRAFREYLHAYLLRMIGLDPPSPGKASKRK